MKDRLANITAKTAIGLIIAEVIVIIVSWIIAAAMPEIHVRSILSNEGIRWLFGSFTSNLMTPLLVWLLFICMAWGALRTSGLLSIKRPMSYRQRFALRIALIEIISVLIIMLLLTALPHAVLLSATGSLYPSSFSHSLIPVVCITVMMAAVSYALFAGTYRKLSDAVGSLVVGFNGSGSVWLIYILLIELFESIKFVFI